MKPQGHIPERASPSAHEASDLEPRLILRVTIIILATLVALVLAGVLLFQLYAWEYPARSSEAAPQVTAGDLPPAPRLQTNPRVDLQTVRAREDAHLNRYAWVDRQRGIAQIPIERAMALWVENYQPQPTSTNRAPEVTELQMRQLKAQEVNHAP